MSFSSVTSIIVASFNELHHIFDTHNRGYASQMRIVERELAEILKEHIRSGVVTESEVNSLLSRYKVSLDELGTRKLNSLWRKNAASSMVSLKFLSGNLYGNIMSIVFISVLLSAFLLMWVIIFGGFDSLLSSFFGVSL